VPDAGTYRFVDPLALGEQSSRTDLDLRTTGPRVYGATSTAMIRQAVRLAVAAGGSLRERRRAFLRACWPYLGPTQRQHVSDHCWVVSTAAARLGRILGLDNPTLRSLTMAGLFHDIGKCLIPESILVKPARLDAAERTVMGRHVPVGSRIAADLGADGEIRELVLHHHTPADRAPDDAGALPVSQAARLLCVADALVSMMSDRPYCPARTARQALAELRRCTGTQFDSTAVDTAHRLYRNTQAA